MARRRDKDAATTARQKKAPLQWRGDSSAVTMVQLQRRGDDGAGTCSDSGDNGKATGLAMARRQRRVNHGVATKARRQRCEVNGAVTMARRRDKDAATTARQKRRRCNGAAIPARRQRCSYNGAATMVQGNAATAGTTVRRQRRGDDSERTGSDDGAGTTMQ
jgi:hypothetical protein